MTCTHRKYHIVLFEDFTQNGTSNFAGATAQMNCPKCKQQFESELERYRHRESGPTILSDIQRRKKMATNDRGEASAGVVAVLVIFVIIIVAALLIFGGRLFGEKKGVDVNISAPSK